MTEPSSYFLLTDIFDKTDKFLLNNQVTTLGQAVSSALNGPQLNFPTICVPEPQSQDDFPPWTGPPDTPQ